MFVVEESYFDNGKVIVKVRKAAEGEEPSFVEKNNCDFYIQTFATKKEAEEYAKQATLA